MEGRRGVAPPAEKCAGMVHEALLRTLETILQARVAPHELPRRASRTRFNLDVDEAPAVRALVEPVWRRDPHRAVRATVAWHHGGPPPPPPGAGGGAEEPGDGMVLLERWDVQYVSSFGGAGTGEPPSPDGGGGGGNGGGSGSSSLGSSWTHPEENVNLNIILGDDGAPLTEVTCRGIQLSCHGRIICGSERGHTTERRVASGVVSLCADPLRAHRVAKLQRRVSTTRGRAARAPPPPPPPHHDPPPHALLVRALDARVRYVVTNCCSPNPAVSTS